MFVYVSLNIHMFSVMFPVSVEYDFHVHFKPIPDVPQPCPSMEYDPIIMFSLSHIANYRVV